MFTQKDELIEILMQPRTIAEIVKLTGLDRTTVTSRLGEMRKWNYVAKIKGNKYTLTPAYKKGLA